MGAIWHPLCCRPRGPQGRVVGSQKHMARCQVLQGPVCLEKLVLMVFTFCGKETKLCRQPLLTPWPREAVVWAWLHSTLTPGFPALLSAAILGTMRHREDPWPTPLMPEAPRDNQVVPTLPSVPWGQDRPGEGTPGSGSGEAAAQTPTLPQPPAVRRAAWRSGPPGSVPTPEPVGCLNLKRPL